MIAAAVQITLLGIQHLCLIPESPGNDSQW